MSDPLRPSRLAPDHRARGLAAADAEPISNRRCRSSIRITISGPRTTATICCRFSIGREQIRQFLAAKWTRELDYRLIKGSTAFTDDRIAVKF